MGIKHDLALLDITVFLEESGNLLLRETWMDAGDEQVGPWVDCAIILGSTTVVLGRSAASTMLESSSFVTMHNVLTGYRHHFHLGKQIDEGHLEGCHCDGLGEEMRYAHDHNAEPLLRVESVSKQSRKVLEQRACIGI